MEIIFHPLSSRQPFTSSFRHLVWKICSWYYLSTLTILRWENAAVLTGNWHSLGGFVNSWRKVNEHLIVQDSNVDFNNDFIFGMVEYAMVNKSSNSARKNDLSC